MELRFIQSNDFFYPQIKQNGVWIYIIVDPSKGRSLLYKLAQSLANLDGIHYSFGEPIDNSWYTSDKQIVYFTKEIYVMSYLGAFKSFHKSRTEEFTL